jgi:hypothetical protein
MTRHVLRCKTLEKAVQDARNLSSGRHRSRPFIFPWYGGRYGGRRIESCCTCTRRRSHCGVDAGRHGRIRALNRNWADTAARHRRILSRKQIDAYFAANGIPELLFLLAGGALTFIFIFYTKCLGQKDRKKTNLLFSQVANVVLIITGVICFMPRLPRQFW